MPQLDAFKKDLFKIVSLALLSLFLIPFGAWRFAHHAQAARDAEFIEGVSASIEQDAKMSREDKDEAKQFFQTNPPSSVCNNDNPKLARYRSRVCEPYSELWQYGVVNTVSTWTLLGGAAALLTILGIGAVAFINRQAQYFSFAVGWNLLRVIGALEVIVQGALLVWLSFWLTAFFWESYYPKLILIAGILAGGAVIVAVRGIFKRPPPDAAVEGELVAEQDAPRLWAHLRACAERLGTAPPERIVAGIDANFYVTEAPLTVGAQTLRGRSLFVSLPLLRVLDREQADAVLAHELAHFSGGDTASSAALGPKLLQYDHYCRLMRHGGATIAVFYLLQLYRVIFELARRRDGREREFLADRVAAKLVFPRAIASSLVKVAAYANYRSQVEEQLFARTTRHNDALGIAAQVAAGLSPYAASTQFVDSMKWANVPHPFDSHPPLMERMRNVGHVIEEREYGAIVTQEPGGTWVSDIQTADAIEQRLWSNYEQRFAEQHEHSLAYRYEPANDAERAIVLKYFPPVGFPLRRGKRIEVNYAGLLLPESEECLSWDRVKNLKYTDGIGGDVLQIEHPEKGWLGAKSTKVKLPGIGKQRNAFKQALGHYWRRHQVMRAKTA